MSTSGDSEQGKETISPPAPPDHTPAWGNEQYPTGIARSLAMSPNPASDWEPVDIKTADRLLHLAVALDCLLGRISGFFPRDFIPP